MKRFLKAKDPAVSSPNSRPARLSPFADKQIAGADTEAVHLVILDVHKEQIRNINVKPSNVCIPQIRPLNAPAIMLFVKHFTKLAIRNFAQHCRRKAQGIWAWIAKGLSIKRLAHSSMRGLKSCASFGWPPCFIQDRRDASLLLQWGEGNLDRTKPLNRDAFNSGSLAVRLDLRCSRQDCVQEITGLNPGLWLKRLEILVNSNIDRIYRRRPECHSSGHDHMPCRN